MPTPQEGQTQEEFLEICIPQLIDEGKPQDQAIAICNSLWQERNKMPDKSQLLEDIRSRKSRSGIVTADRYFSDLDQCFHGDSCPVKTLGFTRGTWDSALKEAQSKLTYNAPTMEFMKGSIAEPIGSGIATLDIVVTTPKRDRDKDYLLTEGAVLDMKSPLLWQHMPMQPIGGMLEKLEHTDKRLVVRMVLADTELARDTLSLIKVGALRVSHGFEPIEYEPTEDEEGYLFKKYEIYEISGVSIPSNTDAGVISISEKDFKTDAVKQWAASMKQEEKKETCSCQKSLNEKGGDPDLLLKVPEKYSHISFSVTESMKKAANRALEWRDEFGRGGTEVGIARGRDISNGKDLSPETWRRMKSFFARHEVDKEAEGFNQGEEGYPSNGRIAWDLWGGDAGKSRAEKIVKQMDAADEKESEAVIQKAGSRISQSTKSELDEVKADLEEICEMDGIPRSAYILAEHALSKLNYLMGDEEKQFGEVKRKFFSFMANADISTLRDIRTTVNLITDASESEEDERAWQELFASF